MAETELAGYKPFVDFVEAGSGPLVVLVHSSLSAARQWPGSSTGNVQFGRYKLQCAG